jgi:hypothetical protein
MKKFRVLVTLLLIAVSSSGVRSQMNHPTSSPYRFHRIQIGGGGFISGVLFHPSVKGLAYVRTDIGGAYRQDTAGGPWAPLLDWVSNKDANLLGVESLAIDPARPDDLYLAVGTYIHHGAPDGAILISHDRGRTFQRVPLPFPLGGNEPARFAGERLALDPSHPGTLYLGTRSDGLWRSKDSGHTWAALAGLPSKGATGIGVTFVVAGKNAQGRPEIYAGVADGADTLFQSVDGGERWHAIPGSPSGYPYHAAFGSDGMLYVTYGNAPGPNDVTAGGVYRLSSNSRWTAVTPPSLATGDQHYGYAGLAVDPSTPATVMVATLDRWHPGDTIFRSRDQGATWTSLKEKAVNDSTATPFLRDKKGATSFGHWIGTVAIDPFQPDHALYGTGATLWETNDLSAADRDGATHWLPATRGIEETAVLSLVRPAGSQRLYMGLGDIGCFRTEGAAAGQEAATLAGVWFSNCDSVAIAANRENVMAAVGRTWASPATHPAHGVYSEDGGATWSRFAAEPEGAAEGGQIVLSADGMSMVWVTLHNGAFLSHNQGRNWNAAPIPRVSEAVAQADGSFVMRNGNDGSVWRLDAHSDAPPSRFLTDDLHGDEHIAVSGQAVWIFGNSGLWAVRNSRAQRMPSIDAVYAIGFGRSATPQSPATIFVSGNVAGHRGIFRSLDNALSWQRIDDASHGFGSITTLTGDPQVFGRIFLGTNGLGVIVAEPASETPR